MLLPIEKGTGNKILRTVSKPLGRMTKKTFRLVKDMEETMHSVNGVGLAAPQIGLNDRLVIITLKNGIILPLVNPQIMKTSRVRKLLEEGCLSLPGQWGKVNRFEEVTVKFTTLKEQEVTMKFRDFEAQEIQHEVDHLNGTLFIDHLKLEDIVYDNETRE